MKAVSVAGGLRPLLRKYRGWVAALITTGTIAALCEGIGVSLFLPLLRSLDGDKSGGGDSGGALTKWFEVVFGGADMRVVLGAMFGLLALKAILSAANGLLYAHMDARMVHDLRNRVAERILGARLGAIEQRSAGELHSLMQTQTWETSSAVAILVGLVIRLVTVLVFGSALLLISWKMTAIVAGALLLISWLVRLLSRRVDRLSEEDLREWNAYVQRGVEMLRGLRTTHAFFRRDHERRRFRESSARSSAATLRLERCSVLVEPLSELMVATLLAMVLLLALQDANQLPAVLTFLFILFRLQPQVQRLDAARVQLAAAGASVRAVREFLSEDDGSAALEQGRGPFRGLTGGIELNGVTFRYAGQDPKQAALRAVSARIEARKTTAIVGPSGAGKSSLAYLLMRFADPDAGVIDIDGTPLTELDLGQWRAGISLVSQDAHVFHDSVIENIRYGREDASDEEIFEAARRAHAHGFIEALPNGYETVLGEHGVQLSGGQRQRIALARALVRRAGILILDEATNALDSIAENMIQDALAELSGTHTLVVIAHRLATVDHVDHILVVDHGEIVEQGSREELLTSDGMFAQLYRLQFGRTT